nr:MAG TPA: hypothetical protein [Caudoviricetes sp.]
MYINFLFCTLFCSTIYKYIKGQFNVQNAVFYILS